MAGKDIIMLSPQELKRLHIIRKALNKELTQSEASKILSLSERQIRRIVRRVRKEGDRGVGHQSRGKPSKRMSP